MTDERRSSISNATSYEEMGEFWDNHDLCDYMDESRDVTDQIELNIQSVRHLVAVAPELMGQAIARSHHDGISVQTFINLAIKDALDRREQH